MYQKKGPVVRGRQARANDDARQRALAGIDARAKKNRNGPPPREYHKPEGTRRPTKMKNLRVR